MKYILRHSFIFVLLILSLGNVYSQAKFKTKKHPTNKWHQRHLMYINNIRVTGMVGLSSYYGDLCDQFICFKYRPGVTVGAYWRYNARMSFRGDLTYLRMAGDDKNGDNKSRNLSFRSPNMEFAAGVMYDILPFDRNFHNRSTLTPYVFLELGFLYYNPRAEYNGKWYSLRPLMTEGHEYGKITASIPFGGGVRLKINSVMDLCFELAYRKTFSDYLDDVSTKFVNNAGFSDPIAAALADRTVEGGFKVTDPENGQHWAAGHQRGNPTRKDGYFLFGLKFEYMIATTKQIHNINSMPRFRNRFPGMHRKYR